MGVGVSVSACMQPVRLVRWRAVVRWRTSGRWRAHIRIQGGCVERRGVVFWGVCSQGWDKEGVRLDRSFD